MNRYKVISPISFKSGHFALTAEQVRHRFGNHEKLEDGTYNITGYMEFGIGEELIAPEPITDLGILQKLEILELDNPVLIGAVNNEEKAEEKIVNKGRRSGNKE